MSAGLNSGLNSSHNLGPIPIASGTGGYLKASGKASNSRSETVFTRARRRAPLLRALLLGAGFRKTAAVKVLAKRRSPVSFLSAIVPPTAPLKSSQPFSAAIKKQNDSARYSCPTGTRKYVLISDWSLVNIPGAPQQFSGTMRTTTTGDQRAVVTTRSIVFEREERLRSADSCRARASAAA